MANADLCFTLACQSRGQNSPSSKLLRGSQRAAGAAQGAEGRNHLTGPCIQGRKRGQQGGKAVCSSMNEPRNHGLHHEFRELTSILPRLSFPQLLEFGLSFHCFPPPQPSLRKLSFKALVTVGEGRGQESVQGRGLEEQALSKAKSSGSTDSTEPLRRLGCLPVGPHHPADLNSGRAARHPVSIQRGCG